MGTSAGPSLQGIGRGGDSNLVLEMDAHDAKSYPGEPTINYAPPDLANWDDSGTSVRTAAGYTFQGQPVYKCRTQVGSSWIGIDKTISGLQTAASGGSVTMSIWVKNPNPNQYSFYAYIGHDFSSTRTLTANSDWQKIEWTVAVGSMANNYVEYRPYTNSADKYIHMTMPQVEVKGYATPFVREGKGGTGTYNARPASVNLMIHGNVGTGQTFSDSSPSKHTITANGNTTHSAAQSKFSGGSVYFDGTGDYLSVPDSSDWAFGAGDFTIDLWFYSTDNGENYRGLVCQVPSPYTSAAGLFLEVDAGTAGQLRLFVRNGSGDLFTELNSAVSTIALNTWYHTAVVRSGDTMSLYLDGISLGVGGAGGSTPYTGTWPDWSAPLDIGFRKDQTKYWEGYMDEVRITKGTALWTSAFTPPTRRNLSAPVVDRSGNDNGGNFATKETTDVTNYRVGEVIRPIDSAAWDFDGTDDLTTIGYHSSLDTPNAATFSVWLYPEANGEFLNRGTSDSGASPDNPRFYVYWNLQKFYFDWSATASDQYVTTAAGGFPANTWVNVVATVVAGGRMEVYINGGVASYETRSNADSMANPLPNTNDPILLGGAPWIPRYFAGKIASIGIYDVALTEQQIVENFNQQRNRFKI